MERAEQRGRRRPGVQSRGGGMDMQISSEGGRGGKRGGIAHTSVFPEMKRRIWQAAG